MDQRIDRLTANTENVHKLIDRVASSLLRCAFSSVHVRLHDVVSSSDDSRGLPLISTWRKSSILETPEEKKQKNIPRIIPGENEQIGCGERYPLRESEAGVML